MIGIRRAGKYNVDFEGKSYDKVGSDKCYEMVIIEEFDENDKPLDKKKTLYFRCGEDLVIPEFKTEAEAERYLCYPNNSKLSVKMAAIITVER